MLSFNNLKLLFVLIYQKSLYLIYNNNNNNVLFIVFVQTKLYIKSSFSICLYIF